MNVLIVEGHSGVAQVLSSYVKLCGHATLLITIFVCPIENPIGFDYGK